MRPRSRLVRAEEARLRLVFRTLLVASVSAPGAFLACSSSESVNHLPLDASTEADHDAAVDATASEGSSPETGAGDAPSEAMASEGGGDGGGADATDAADAGDAGDAGDAEPRDGQTDDVITDANADDVPDVSRYCDNAKVSKPYYLDASGACVYYRDFSCAEYPVLKNTCFLTERACNEVCDLHDAGTLFNCEYTFTACTLAGVWIAEAGQPVTVECALCPGVGRRPQGLARVRRARASGSVGRYFERAAHLEAASVVAFERLEKELAQHGAPGELVHLARRSACDEVRHAKVTARMARRFGGNAPPVRVGRGRVRSLEQVARENAVEGCVRETFGALVATWQASHAGDAQVRRSLSRIASDETRHAALAWAVARWADVRLDDAARARVRRAQLAAVRKLRAELAVEVPEDLVQAAGLPRAARATAMLDGMLARL